MPGARGLFKGKVGWSEILPGNSEFEVKSCEE